MEYHLPEMGADAIVFPHFPTRQQAFIFRAFEFVTPEKIAAILKTTPENIVRAAADMGLTAPCTGDVWLEKGYITIIRSLWHILPYEQLMELLETNRASFAKLLREEDFLDIKLGKQKPICEPLVWRELTEEEKKQTALIRDAMADVNMRGAAPFDFSYAAPKMEFSGKPLVGNRMIYGFSSLYHFSKVFKQETSFTPSEYASLAERSF